MPQPSRTGAQRNQRSCSRSSAPIAAAKSCPMPPPSAVTVEGRRAKARFVVMQSRLRHEQGCRPVTRSGGTPEPPSFMDLERAANAPLSLLPVLYGEKVRMRGGGIRQRQHVWPPLTPALSPLKTMGRGGRTAQHTIAIRMGAAGIAPRRGCDSTPSQQPAARKQSYRRGHSITTGGDSTPSQQPAALSKSPKLTPPSAAPRGDVYRALQVLSVLQTELGR